MAKEYSNENDQNLAAKLRNAKGSFLISQKAL